MVEQAIRLREQKRYHDIANFKKLENKIKSTKTQIHGEID